jgi:hypothetical protein
MESTVPALVDLDLLAEELALLAEHLERRGVRIAVELEVDHAVGEVDVVLVDLHLYPLGGGHHRWRGRADRGEQHQGEGRFTRGHRAPPDRRAAQSPPHLDYLYTK